MAASAARGSFGAVFYVGSTSGTFMSTTTAQMLAVGELLTVTAPVFTANTIDITNQNTADLFKESLSGVRDPGSLSITANYISSTTMHQKTIPDYFYNGLKMPWAIQVSGTSSMNCWGGFGYITSYTVTSPPDGAVTFAASIKVTGKPAGPLSGTSLIFA